MDQLRQDQKRLWENHGIRAFVDDRRLVAKDTSRTGRPTFRPIDRKGQFLLDKVERICRKLNTRREASRLWNVIDHQVDPEPLWDAMLARVPWAFSDPLCTNSIIGAAPFLTHARKGT